jgi:hypothetical protein
LQVLEAEITGGANCRPCLIYPRPMRSRGLLFVVLATGLIGIAVAAFRADALVIAVAAAVLGVWMGDLARRDLRPRP